MQTRVIDLGCGNAQQLRQRALAIEVFGDVKFTRWLAEPANHQHQRHARPVNPRASARQVLAEEVVQPKLLDQLQGQPRAAKLHTVFHANRRRVDRNPLRLDLRAISVLRVFTCKRQTLLVVDRSICRSRLLDSQPTFFIEPPQVGHDTLPGTTVGAKRLDQRPIRVSLSILLSIAGANEHARRSYGSKRPRQPQKSSLQHDRNRMPTSITTI